MRTRAELEKLYDNTDKTCDAMRELYASLNSEERSRLKAIVGFKEIAAREVA